MARFRRFDISRDSQVHHSSRPGCLGHDKEYTDDWLAVTCPVCLCYRPVGLVKCCYEADLIDGVWECSWHPDIFIEANGTSYPSGTPRDLIAVLERCRLERTRCRFVFEDRPNNPWGTTEVGMVSRRQGLWKTPMRLYALRHRIGPHLDTDLITKVIGTVMPKGVLYERPDES